MTTNTQPFRMTREEWLALPLEAQLGAPINDARTTPKNYACHAHYRLDSMRIQIAEVEVVDDADADRVIVRLAFAAATPDAPSILASLRDLWVLGGADTPMAKPVSFEAMRPN